MGKLKSKKHWSNAEVEVYTKKLLASSEVSLAEQRDRIASLKKQNENLIKEITQLKDREKVVGNALTETTRRAREIEQITKAKAELEIEKVKQFSYKWTNHFDELAKMHPEYAGINVKKQFNAEVKDLIDQILETNNLKSDGSKVGIYRKPKAKITKNDWFLSEMKRSSENKEKDLSPENEKRFNEIISKIKTSMIHSLELNKPNKSGFNIEEALNPKDSLDKILGDIIK